MKNRAFWRSSLDAAVIQQAAQAWNLPDFAAELLLRRHVTYEDLDTNLPMASPFALRDMDRACDVIHKHLAQGKRVRVYGDYDADGVTATALLVRALEQMGYAAQIDYYIPDRFDEGYGLHEDAVVDAVRDGIDLMITVDCGSSSPKAARLAASLGLTLVVTDHHALPLEIPQASALVNPQQDVAADKLSGAGVALQLVRGLRGDDVPDELYGIAAVGTVADVVPVVGMNRQLVRRGLQAIAEGQVAAVTALLGVEAVRRVTAQDLGFSVGPRLNAAGRLGRADTAVQLFLERDSQRIDALAQELTKLNRERRQVEMQITEKAWENLLRDHKGRLYPFTVIAGDDWHQGVIGIVASRFREWLRRPVAVIAWDGDFGKGSARGVPALNLINHLRQSADRFTRLGGHAGAAGFSLKRQDVHLLSAVLSEQLPQAVVSQQFEVGEFDLMVPPHYSSRAVWTGLQAFEPFGHGFEAPRFLVKGHLRTIRQVGPEGQHVQFSLHGDTVSAIGFGLGERARGLRVGDPVRFVAALETNWYHSKAVPQWQVLLLDGPWPRATRHWSRGYPDPLPTRVLWVVDSDRAVWREARRQLAWPYALTLPVGDLVALEEQARCGLITKVVASQWRPWPRLLNWADAVIWTCVPRSQSKWEESASLLQRDGQLWLAPSASGAPPRRKAHQLQLTREGLGRHWRRWQRNDGGFSPGRAVFRELELTPAAAMRGERRSIAMSHLYQMALWESKQDAERPFNTAQLGRAEMHGVD